MNVFSNSFSTQFIGDRNKCYHQLYHFGNVLIFSVVYNICSYESWQIPLVKCCNCNLTFHMSYWEAIRACTELNVRWNQHKCLIAWNKPNQGWDNSLYSRPVSMTESIKCKCIRLLSKNTLGLIRKYYFLERKWKSLSHAQLFATPWTIWSM